MSGPFKMKGNPLKRNFELKVGKGQGSKREGKYTVDPDAPGYKYGPGYEPPVSEEDKSPLTGKKRKARKILKKKNKVNREKSNRDITNKYNKMTDEQLENLRNKS